MPKTVDSKKRQIIYTGRVQGVGFRYTTARIARRFPVTGYVRNLADGTVELIAHGTAATLDQLQSEIASRFADNIQDCQVSEDESNESFTTFNIRR